VLGLKICATMPKLQSLFLIANIQLMFCQGFLECQEEGEMKKKEKEEKEEEEEEEKRRKGYLSLFAPGFLLVTQAFSEPRGMSSQVFFKYANNFLHTQLPLNVIISQRISP
jgi:hypothetical protein